MYGTLLCSVRDLPNQEYHDIIPSDLVSVTGKTQVDSSGTTEMDISGLHHSKWHLIFDVLVYHALSWLGCPIYQGFV